MSIRTLLASGVIALPFGVGIAATQHHEEPPAAFAFADREISESSGLVEQDGLLITTNDSGDVGRIFAVDPQTGQTVGTTRWDHQPIDVEALAPGWPGYVWVGDIGDNAEVRKGVWVSYVPIGRSDLHTTPQTFLLVYPDGPHNAETLLADPDSGQLYVVTKDVFGGTVYRTPWPLVAGEVNTLERVAEVGVFATDGTVVTLASGQHLAVIREYAGAGVYTFPDFVPVERIGLPWQRQGEGIAAASDGTLWLSSEGIGSDVLKVALPG